MPNIVWITLPTTCPVRTAAREMAMVRNRAMMPSVMSIAIAIAVPCAPPATAINRMPGTTYRGSRRGPRGAWPAKPRAQRGAEDIDEQQQEDNRHGDDDDHHDGVALHVQEIAAQHCRRVAHCIGERVHRRVSLGVLLCVGVAREGQEDVVEIGRVDRQSVDLDRFIDRAGPARRAATARRRRSEPAA